MVEMHKMRDTPQQMAAPKQVATFKNMSNLLGAALSVGLMIGVGVWGYKLLVRDVSGVPVIRAAKGPMRVLPDDPGGSQAAHQGLAVNAVAALGSAADPADRLVLAPEALDLSLEDEPVRLGAVAQFEPAKAEAADVELPKVSDTVGEQKIQSIEDFAEKLANEVEPLQDLEPATDLAEDEAIAATPTVKGGLGRSLRPHLRPATFTAAPATNGGQIDVATVSSGAYMAQLGAFESPEVARSEWDRLSGEFNEYLDGKGWVIQRAESGGRIFYRLRAMGFSDLNDARRFCSALIAEGAKCISVVSR